LTVCKI